ncbi:hypothetical protein [Nonomuraea sp. SYSU D8015]|uniref:hypothetical protein n=1 Tax=Nonomuraea sp. SYSU D8015 TaxID=2593644 RepID=UPI001660D2E8|nr:hypothetical protein [Nonomuraea sp. SYSU D8015]
MPTITRRPRATPADALVRAVTPAPPGRSVTPYVTLEDPLTATLRHLTLRVAVNTAER